MRVRPLPLLLCVIACQGVQAQVTFEPRRVSRDFAGEVPMLWVLEGDSKPRSIVLRVLDDQGREVMAPKALLPVPMGNNRYLVTDLWRPSDLWKGRSEGSYVLEWSLLWERPEGGARSERMETSFRLDGLGGGWLQRAYLMPDGLERLEGSTSWPVGATYALQVKAPKALRRVRYQLIDETKETVLRSWTELPLEKGTRWTLPGDGRWPKGAKVLWVWVERQDGSETVLVQELGGKSQGGVQVGSGPVGIQKGLGVPSPKGLQANLGRQSLVATTPSWLQKMDSPSSLGGWANANRVATVQVGYLDEERGTRLSGSAIRLWPSPDNRPMSLSVQGADLLAKPVFSVSYLLEERTAGNGRSPIDIALQAVGSTSGPNFPPGAKQLLVGAVTTPVVFQAGTMEDFLGKPLVSGFGWAAFDANGAVQSAQSWVRSTPSEPPVGLVAIQQAANLKAKIIEDSLTDSAYTGDKELVRLNEQRQPFGVTLASQDPTGRPILSRALGSKISATETLPFGEMKAQTQKWTQTFDGINLPPGITVDGGWDWDTSGTQPALVLHPAMLYRDCWPDRDQEGNPIEHCEDYDGPCGLAQLAIGMVYPKAQVSLDIQISGPFEAKWVVDGQEQAASINASGHLDTSWLASRTLPLRLALRLRNTRQLGLGIPDQTTDQVRITQLSMDSNLGMAGLEVNESYLDSLTSSRIPGFTFMQYGTVDIQGQGTCSVSMVTDPDGSAVAEVKDPEGRTIYKIVNPTSAYTDQFFDFRGRAFLPAAPLHRGAIVQSEALKSAVQQNLVTQYVFDQEGHLRGVVPPKGFTGAVGGWSYAPDNASLVSTLGWAQTVSGMSTLNPLPYATHNAYDGSGHLVASFNPDEGTTRFWVDQKGRVHFSQTEGQRKKSPQSWTRTYYDQIFRVVAVGETTTAPGIDPESTGVVPANTVSTAFPDLNSASLSRNLYDAYVAGEDDPTASASGLPQPVRDLLPAKELWERFPDGHLTLTYDPNTRERYFYDQDGRIVIRWVSLKDSGGAWKHFAIGIYYDFAGRVKRLVYPAGPGGDPLQVVYTYDELGRLFAVGTPQDRAYFARYAYQPTGEVRSVIYGPGEGLVAKRMVQDPQGWLRSLTVQGK